MTVKGRFAPTPSGRMHLGNLLSALLAWLDVRSVGGELVLRIEDLDTQRTSPDFAAQLMDDLRWLGLDWDEGGLESEYMQSRRTAYYEDAFRALGERGFSTRAIAPGQSGWRPALPTGTTARWCTPGSATI